VTTALDKVNLVAPDSMAQSILSGFELVCSKMQNLHKETMSRVDFLESKLDKGMSSMQQQIKSLQQHQQQQVQVQQKQQQQKKPAALTAVKNWDDLVRYYPVLQCTPSKVWCTVCCVSGPSMGLIDDGLDPIFGIWDATRPFKDVKATLFEEGRPSNFFFDKWQSKLVHLQPPLRTATKCPISQFYVQSRNMSVGPF